MPIPFSDEVDVHPEVGAKPTTWYSGAAIGGTLWENIKTMRFFTDFIGTRPGNKSDTIWGILSADDGQGSAGKALIVDNTGAIANIQGVGINTTTPTERLHIVNGDVLLTGGTMNVGKNEDQTAHLGRARISHFNTTNTQTGAALSSASFSHHDCTNAANFALVQSAVGETLLNSDTGKHTSFRIGGVEKMRVHSNGFIGINEQAPAEALDVGGNIKASGNVVATNIKNFYQTTNNANSTVADSSDNTTQVTDAGCPSTASVWTQYTSWKTSGSEYTNSNTNVFSPQTYGFKALVAGTYKITVHMTFQTTRTNQNVVIRLSKNALVDDVADSDNENPGPLAATCL